LYDRRVRWLLEQSIDEGEQVRFGIEGMDGQCIIALDERLLVIKPGFVRGTDFGGLAASISYADITSIETNVAASNSVSRQRFRDATVAVAVAVAVSLSQPISNLRPAATY
jgi:hypothetical protein